ncbi:unnamed protein product [Linum trigynum]|uniref:Uncharacterized protein n=1 Tax=Linum trigynum TaxID=586398 RepID=A0AAV2DZR8_9ROSI
MVLLDLMHPASPALLALDVGKGDALLGLHTLEALIIVIHTVVYSAWWVEELLVLKTQQLELVESGRKLVVDLIVHSQQAAAWSIASNSMEGIIAVNLLEFSLAPAMMLPELSRQDTIELILVGSRP